SEKLAYAPSKLCAPNSSRRLPTSEAGRLRVRIRSDKLRLSAFSRSTSSDSREGSHATTVFPKLAISRVSRPVPQPISRTRLLDTSDASTRSRDTLAECAKTGLSRRRLSYREASESYARPLSLVAAL